MGNEKVKNEKKEFKPWSPKQLFGWAVVIWAGMTAIFLTLAPSPNELGDTFGAVNALFSGLAFAGLIVTIQQQHEELRETRREMETQSKHLDAQSKQMNLQARLMALSTSLSVQPELISRFFNEMRTRHKSVCDQYLVGNFGIGEVEKLIINQEQPLGGGVIADLRKHHMANQSGFDQSVRILKGQSGVVWTQEQIEAKQKVGLYQKEVKRYAEKIEDLKAAQDDLMRLRDEIKQLFDDKRKLQMLQRETEQISKPAEAAQSLPPQ